MMRLLFMPFVVGFTCMVCTAAAEPTVNPSLDGDVESLPDRALTMEKLIERLSHELPESRIAASRQISRRFRDWKEVDLNLLRKAAQQDGDLEVSSRARHLLEAITVLRNIPKGVELQVPGIVQKIRSGSPDELADLVGTLEKHLKEKSLDRLDVAQVLIELLDDNRKTSKKPEFSHHGPKGRAPEELTVSEVARALLMTIVCKESLSTRKEWRAWWKTNRDKPEKEWYLEDLALDYDVQHANAVSRLARLRDPAIYPEIFKSLHRFRSNNSELCPAIASLSVLPKDVLVPGLRPFLQDKRPYVRLEAARILFRLGIRESVNAVVESHTKPEGIDLTGLDPRVWREGYQSVEWLASTRDPEAYDFLFQALRTGPTGLKAEIIGEIYEQEVTGVDEALLQAFSDQEIEPVAGGVGGVTVSSPRVADLAGIHMVCRLKMKEEFNWICSRRKRDRNLAIIRNHWRKSKGMKPLPLPGVPVRLVPKEKVAELMPAVTSDDTPVRSAGTRELLKLGPGAWPHLLELINDSEGVMRERLEHAADLFANTLRTVEVNGDDGRIGANLKKRLHLPFDPEAVLRDVAEPWFEDNEMHSIHIELEMEEDGKGVAVYVSVTRGENHEEKPQSFAYFPPAVAKWDRNILLKEWNELLNDFRASGRTGQRDPLYRWLKMEKRW